MEKTKITYPDDCGNSPKKIFLRDFNIAFVKSDVDFILDSITDDVYWDQVGEDNLNGKEAFANILTHMQDNKIVELHIQNIITHGNVGSLNGTMTMENRKTYAFCDVYEFASSRNNLKIKALTSYIIDIS